MNGNDIMRAMSGIDDKFLSKAETRVNVKRNGLSKFTVKVICGIAVTSMLAIPAGAYAYKHFIHHDNVEHYIKNADQLEGRDLALNAQTENDELKFTVDTLLCDGKQAYGVLTVERIGENAGKELALRSYAATVVYADNGEFITHNWGGSGYFDGTEEVGQHRLKILIDISDVDTSRGIKLLFREMTPTGNFYGEGKYEGQKDDNGSTIRYDCEVEVPVETNVNTVKLYDSENNEITFSEFEVYGDGSVITPHDLDIDPGTFVIGNTEYIFHNFSLIDKNGEKHSLLEESGGGYMEDYSYIYFEKLIDIDEYIGVEINGKEYLKKE